MGSQIDWIRSTPLLDGLDGTNQTLAAMARLVREGSADLLVRNKALEIVRDCPGHDFDCEIEALFYYVRDQTTYRRDPVETELIADARRTLFVFGTGDCDDRSVALASLLGSLGHKSRFKVLGQKRGVYNHVYIETQTKDGSWKALDITPEQAPPGWQARGHAATYEIFPTIESPLLLIGAAVLLYYFLR